MVRETVIAAAKSKVAIDEARTKRNSRENPFEWPMRSIQPSHASSLFLCSVEVC